MTNILLINTVYTGLFCMSELCVEVHVIFWKICVNSMCKNRTYTINYQFSAWQLVFEQGHDYDGSQSHRYLWMNRLSLATCFICFLIRQHPQLWLYFPAKISNIMTILALLLTVQCLFGKLGLCGVHELLRSWNVFTCAGNAIVSVIRTVLVDKFSKMMFFWFITAIFTFLFI